MVRSRGAEGSLKKYVYLAVGIVLGVCSPLSAGVVVDIGQIVLMSNSPVTGNQTLEVSNMTGANCDAVIFTVCNGAGINITDWILTVVYTDSDPGTHTSTFGPNSTDPIAPLTGPDFAPFSGTFSLPWTFDESCTGTCPSFVTVIQSATLTGSISSTNLTLFDGSTFFASPTFTLNYTPTLSFDTGLNWVFYDPADIFVDAADGGAGGDPVPEPSTLSFILIGAGAISVSRSIRHRNTIC
jgi:hypothetical protein